MVAERIWGTESVCVRGSIKKGGVEVDLVTQRIGLRQIGVRREKDSYGESFAHEVNGITIFAMGADYIPQDNIFGRITPKRTRKLLENCAEANFNIIRVWGGGYYPEDDFLDACDELGLLVWQDFMFACAVYELTDAFEENITAEFIDNIKRIRNHACLALWCGNNEMEMFVAGGGWGNSPKQMGDYFKMYEYIIPKLLKKYDPDTFYWPASPSSGGGFDNPNDESRGDVHYWDVCHGGKPITEFRKFYFRYASEFGFQSFPSIRTIESFTLLEDRNPFSYVMEKHQRNNGANGKLMAYMEQEFLYPMSMETAVYASQVLQAEAIRNAAEHFRRYRGRCMGAIYWQLNDIWPGISWFSIDYYGRWKALHYYAKRFFAPVLLSCEEESMMTQERNINAENVSFRKSVRFNVSNETRQAKKAEIRWNVRKNDGSVLREERTELEVSALTASFLPKCELPELESFTANFQVLDYTKDFLKIGWESPNFSYRYEKEMCLTGNSLRMHYYITNIGEDELPAIWTWHGLMRYEEDMEILLPEGTRQCRNVLAEDNLGKPDTIYPYENPVYNFAKVPPADSKTAVKYYIEPEAVMDKPVSMPVCCGFLYPSQKMRCLLHYDAGKLPYLGVWITAGGFQGDYNCALEPTNGFYDGVNKAAKNHRLPILAPNEAIEFELAVSLWPEIFPNLF